MRRIMPIGMILLSLARYVVVGSVQEKNMPGSEEEPVASNENRCF